MPISGDAKVPPQNYMIIAKNCRGLCMFTVVSSGRYSFKQVPQTQYHQPGSAWHSWPPMGCRRECVPPALKCSGQRVAWKFRPNLLFTGHMEGWRNKWKGITSWHSDTQNGGKSAKLLAWTCQNKKHKKAMPWEKKKSMN